MHVTGRRLHVILPGVALACALGFLATGARSQENRSFVWLEGEDAASHTFNQHGWYTSDGVRRDVLSPGVPGGAAGDWLAHFSTRDQLAEATYDFTVSASGPHVLWLRTSVYRVRQWYRLDDGPRIEMDLTSDARERINLIAPGIDIRFLAWIRVGALDLAPGPHSLTFGLEHHPLRPDGDVHGGIDALCLVNFPWSPAGGRQPTLDPAPDPLPGAWFPFVPGDDPFAPESITDMSALLHRPAGRHGPVQRAGDRLELADGTPIKLWGIGATMTATPALQEQQARFYAKHGVNLVRQHPVEAVLGLLEPDPGGGRRLDPERLDRFDRWFATLKEHGIYMDWSPFYPHCVTEADGYPAELLAELPDGRCSVGRDSAGYVAFMRELQDAEWAWLRTLLEHENPYTGLRYADDPALAIVEVHNEDSVFWHFPLNGLATGADAPRHTARLQAGWQAWLQGRYSDDAALLAAWGPPGQGSRPSDSLSNSSMAIYGAWEMGADGPHFDKREGPRMGDFIRFLAETQREYYARRGRELRALGYQGLTVSTAWQAGGPAADAANVWTDDALDAVDRHRYFGGGAGGHNVAAGNVTAGSHLAEPGSGILSMGLAQVEDKPFVTSEWCQSPPNQWKAEIAPLVAFYGLGLGGWDGQMHFTSSRPRMGSGWPGERSYVSETPHVFGQFPALAFAVARGHVAEGDLAAARRLAVDDAFLGLDALSQSYPGGGFDPVPPGGSLDTPPEALAMGRVTLKVADGQPRSARADWDALWDRAASTVRSTTGQLEWDYGRRIVTVRTPKTQGVVGFAAGRTIDLPSASVTVDEGTPFVSLLFTPLDDLPLDTSRHILVTALARDRQTGARYSEDGIWLEALGGPPLELEPVQATITFGGGPVSSAQSVDVFGVPTGREIERTGNTVRIDGRYATYYYEIKRAGGPPTLTPTPTATASAEPTGSPPLWRVLLPRLDRPRAAAAH